MFSVGEKLNLYENENSKQEENPLETSDIESSFAELSIEVVIIFEILFIILNFVSFNRKKSYSMRTGEVWEKSKHYKRHIEHNEVLIQFLTDK